MRQVVSCLLLIAFVSVGFGGCATKTQTGAGIGAVTGAGVGALLGAVLGEKRGAAIGAGIGAILGTAVGAQIGKYFEDQEERNRADSVKAVAYTQQQGNLMSISSADVSPRPASPGDEVRVKVSYDILTPNPEQKVPITEQWLVSHEGKPLGKPIARPTQYKTQGGHSSTFKFVVNQDFLPGEYHVLTTISNGETERSIGSVFLVQST